MLRQLIFDLYRNLLISIDSPCLVDSLLWSAFNNKLPVPTYYSQKKLILILLKRRITFNWKMNSQKLLMRLKQEFPLTTRVYPNFKKGCWYYSKFERSFIFIDERPFWKYL